MEVMPSVMTQNMLEVRQSADRDIGDVGAISHDSGHGGGPPECPVSSR